MAEKISIVIPCYNVGAYIGKCLQSVLSQTYPELEVIVVNDGSTDDTAEGIAAWAADPRLLCIDQQNAGVTAARNAGIEASTGEYLAFVDSDDYLAPGMYERLHAALAGAGADAAVCDYNLVFDDRVDVAYSGMRDEIIDAPGGGADYFLRHCACPRPNNYIWTRLYKAGVVKNAGVRFERFPLGDDTLFSFKLLPHMRRVAHISGGMYYYLQRPNSNVYTVANRGNLATVYADTFDALAGYYRENGYEALLSVLPVHAYTRLRSVVFYSRLAGQSEEEIADNIAAGFGGRDIAKYLWDVSMVDAYAAINGFSGEKAAHIKRIMQAAADRPAALMGAMIE